MRGLRGRDRVGTLLLVLLLMLTAVPGVTLYGQTTDRVHVVEAGETLYRIGKRYQVTVAELYRLNPSARQGIRPGDRLVLPFGASLEPVEEALYYEVKQGDTLYSIAQRVGATVSEVMTLNTFLKSPDAIAPGMILKLPPRAALGHSAAPQVVEPAAPDSLNGLRMVTVPAGMTIYSLLKGTPWSEEDFYRYNPAVRERGLKAGEAVFLPDGTIENNLAAKGAKMQGPLPTDEALDVVLALPFASDRERRFSDYYEGFLLSVLEAKGRGTKINLYVFSCDEAEMAKTKRAISALTDVDLLIGGVSMESINVLSDLARDKQATYVIPFSSRDLSFPHAEHIYQVNTPARILFDRAAEKFMETYPTHHVLFVGVLPGEKESPFVRVLKNRLRIAGVTYSECSSDQFTRPEDVIRESTGHSAMVVVPSSTSLAMATQLLSVISSATGGLPEGYPITAFGYPEWQTYASSLHTQMEMAGATYFTTFYIYAPDESYRRFSSDFVRWFGHNTGNTFPRYSALGYDTGSCFLRSAADGEIHPKVYRGVQSLLDFESGSKSGVRSNEGVFFVRHDRDHGIQRF